MARGAIDVTGRLTARARQAAADGDGTCLSLVFEYGALLVPGGADLRELAVSFRSIAVTCRATGEELGMFDLKGICPAGLQALCGLGAPEEHGTWSLGPRTALDLELRRAAPQGVVLAIDHAVAAGRPAGNPVLVSSGWDWTARHVFRGGEQRVELGPPRAQAALGSLPAQPAHGSLPAQPAPGSEPDAGGRRHALLVLGVHRSGTSCMAAALAGAGAAAPRDLMPAMPDNRLGFWESVAVAAFNDGVLQRDGSSWDDVFAGVTLEGALPSMDGKLVEQARSIVCDRFSEQPVIMLKDPRISLLMPLWRRVLRAARYAPYCIIMVREPRQVADSLLRRNGFSRAKGLLLWAGHMLAVERGTRGLPRVFVRFDELPRSAERALRTAGGALALPWLRDVVLPEPEPGAKAGWMARRPGRPPAWELGPFSRLEPFHELLARGPEGQAALEREADRLQRWFCGMEGMFGAMMRESRIQRLHF